MSTEHDKKVEAQDPLDAVRKEIQKVLEKLDTENPKPNDEKIQDEHKSNKPS